MKINPRDAIVPLALFKAKYDANAELLTSRILAGGICPRQLAEDFNDGPKRIKRMKKGVDRSVPSKDLERFDQLMIHAESSMNVSRKLYLVLSEGNYKGGGDRR